MKALALFLFAADPRFVTLQRVQSLTLKAGEAAEVAACPPEDCGGSPGYEDLLEALGNKKHPEHRVMQQWLDVTSPK
jgi:hypothetical protein